MVPKIAPKPTLGYPALRSNLLRGVLKVGRALTVEERAILNKSQARLEELSMYQHLASTKMSDVLRPQSSGETVNVHVTQHVIEPKPDYEAMRRLVTGEQDRELAGPSDDARSAK